MLAGKIAVVTGATGGIGFETAKAFAGRGAQVLVCSRSLERAKKACEIIGRHASPETLDISDPQSVTRLAAKVSEKHGRIDILANIAGHQFDRKIWYKQFHEVSDSEFDSVVQVDLLGTVRVTRAFVQLMLEKGGVVVSVASTPAIAGHTEGAPYTLAKAGVIAMTKHLALEYGSRNIRAYSVALGNVATEATFNAMTEAERSEAAKENAMKRWGQPNEIASAIAALASGDFSFATGNTIVLDGGTVLR